MLIKYVLALIPVGSLAQISLVLFSVRQAKGFKSLSEMKGQRGQSFWLPTEPKEVRGLKQVKEITPTRKQSQIICARHPQVLNMRIYPLVLEWKACGIRTVAGWMRCCAWHLEIPVNKWCAWSGAGWAIVFGQSDELGTGSCPHFFPEQRR